MSACILSLDQGTTSSRSILFDHSGKIVSSAQKEFKQFYPKPGWVEHDAEEIWDTQFATIMDALAKTGGPSNELAGIGITNQRETTVVWDRRSGKPVYHAIVWQDRRTAAYCDALRAAGHTKVIQEKTGLIIDAYFSATKLKWILDEVPGARDRAEKGELAFGTIDSWMIWKLSSGRIHITDVSNASRTMLMNIHTLTWDDELLKLFDIPASVLPEIKASSEIYGSTGNLFEKPDIPLAGVAGDQQAALFGQMCTEPGMVKNTYGTGCFMLMNTGTRAISSNNNLLTTIAWQIDGITQYALEGSVFIAGAVVQWLRDGLQIINHSKEVESLAASVGDPGGVFIVPAFSGLGAPYWNQHARGSIFGLTRGSTRAHLARAALESIAYQVYDVLKAMESDAGIAITGLRVDGGATVNDTLMQFQCDILNTPVIRPRVTETTALGAAYLAGLATGFWKNTEEIRKQWQEEKAFSPSMSKDQRKEFLKGWQRAVRSAMAWADEPGN